ncbi:sigma-70 family RNA polymerase sigma factor [Janthinobacterium sp. P210006]|uniref:sigma-70 family RNA polymerase sigma factor n=1 Tax=Janthinobacterium sp. P210006 TaxID=3112939 RepID=UPI002E262467|nr:sigma-70 family RNA polymerase sigma factor [Janthinobacterium sp. P210006]
MDCALQPELVSSDTDVAALWRMFQQSRDGELRNRIVAHYLRFARIMAAKLYAGRHDVAAEFADYLQYARLGLLEAVDRFEVARGVKFETFAAKRIHGAVLNGLRSLSEVQEQIVARKRIVAERVETLRGADPCPADPAVLFAQLAEMAIGLAVGFALDDTGMYSDTGNHYQDNTYQGIELMQLKESIQVALAQLQGKQRQVITYHYLQQVAFEEIAQILGVSRGRVAQIHKEALGNLREALRKRDGLDLYC